LFSELLVNHTHHPNTLSLFVSLERKREREREREILGVLGMTTRSSVNKEFAP
jgi:hypothetical protein